MTGRLGWLSTLAWQTGIASGSYLTASQIQGLLLLNDATYDFQRWHGTLLIIGIATAAILLNIFLARQLPRVEIVMMVLHCVGFIAIIIPLWVLAPRTPAKTVFTDFRNSGGWPNLGLSVLIGLTGPVYSVIACDCAVHMGKLFAISSLAVVVDKVDDSGGDQRRLAGPSLGHGLVNDYQHHLRLRHGPDLLLLHRRS